MTPGARNVFRAIFWVLFLSGSIAAGIYFYMQKIPPQVDLYLWQMKNPNARVAAEGWANLRHLYYTKWDAYWLALDHVHDDAPIHFLLEQRAAPEGAKTKTAFVADGKPIYHKTDQIHCRTVGEAVLAITHDEGKWKHAYDGEWKEYWARNKRYYVFKW